MKKWRKIHLVRDLETTGNWISSILKILMTAHHFFFTALNIFRVIISQNNYGASAKDLIKQRILNHGLEEKTVEEEKDEWE